MALQKKKNKIVVILLRLKDMLAGSNGMYHQYILHPHDTLTIAQCY